MYVCAGTRFSMYVCLCRYKVQYVCMFVQVQGSVYMYVCIGTRFSDGDGSSNEVQRTMLELINQLDGFDPRGNIKVLMATNR